MKAGWASLSVKHRKNNARGGGDQADAFEFFEPGAGGKTTIDFTPFALHSCVHLRPGFFRGRKRSREQRGQGKEDELFHHAKFRGKNDEGRRALTECFPRQGCRKR